MYYLIGAGCAGLLFSFAAYKTCGQCLKGLRTRPWRYLPPKEVASFDNLKQVFSAIVPLLEKHNTTVERGNASAYQAIYSLALHSPEELLTPDHPMIHRANLIGALRLALEKNNVPGKEDYQVQLEAIVSLSSENLARLTQP